MCNDFWKKWDSACDVYAKGRVGREIHLYQFVFFVYVITPILGVGVSIWDFPRITLKFIYENYRNKIIGIILIILYQIFIKLCLEIMYLSKNLRIMFKKVLDVVVPLLLIVICAHGALLALISFGVFSKQFYFTFLLLNASSILNYHLFFTHPMPKLDRARFNGLYAKIVDRHCIIIILAFIIHTVIRPPVYPSEENTMVFQIGEIVFNSIFLAHILMAYTPVLADLTVFYFSNDVRSGSVVVPGVVYELNNEMLANPVEMKIIFI